MEGGIEDGATALFIEHATKHVRLPANGEDARSMLAAEELDVLVYAEIGEDAFTLLFAHARLARVQVAFWGFCYTSGMAQIDYFLASHYHDADVLFDLARAEGGTSVTGSIQGSGGGGSDGSSNGARPRCAVESLLWKGFTEQVVRFESIASYYLPPPIPPALDAEIDRWQHGHSPDQAAKEASRTASRVAAALSAAGLVLPPLPSAVPSYTLYLCPHSSVKFHPHFDDALLGILASDPTAVLLLVLAHPTKDTLKLRALQGRLRRRAVVLGHPPSWVDGKNHAGNWSSGGGGGGGGGSNGQPTRMVFMHQMGFDELLGLYAVADVLLDPFPYGGGVTSLDALGVGAPIVTAPPLLSVLSLTGALYGRIVTRSKSLPWPSQTAAGLQARQLIAGLMAHSLSDYVRRAVAVASMSTPDKRQLRIILRQATKQLLYEDEEVPLEWRQFLFAAVRSV
jgi:uncharacterized membrane protein YgcG